MFLKILDERDYSDNRTILKDFVCDIYNWDTNVYVNGEYSYHWQYNVFNDSLNKHYFIELRYGDMKVMVVEVITSLVGRILEFNAKYHVNINEYCNGSKNNLATTVIKINCLDDGNIVFEDVVYNLNLLENDNFSEDILSENIISEYGASLVRNNSYK